MFNMVTFEAGLTVRSTRCLAALPKSTKHH